MQFYPNEWNQQHLPYPYIDVNDRGHRSRITHTQHRRDSGGKLSARLYDKHDEFDVHIVNFPFLSSNIPSGASCRPVFTLQNMFDQSIHYDEFRYRHKCLVDRLLSQGYMALRLEKSFEKLHGRYQDLIGKYQRSVNVMVSDSFPE